MIPDLAHLALWLCLALAFMQACMPWLQHGLRHAHAHTRLLSVAQALLLTTSFAGLLASYATSDFTVLNVVLNSHSEKPLIYKLTGAWGNHEGSMLLWVWVLGFFGAMVALFPTHNAQLRHTTLIVHGAILSGFLLFILLTSNPFVRVFPAPPNGEDLNPLLQDIGLALHPPLLYLGYVGFGIVFSFAMAGMKLRVLDHDFARTIHPWILFTWGCLTAGIGMGSWWAYRELGWGGWWFWDPVENVSLLPWLTGTALLHANMLLEKRGECARWVALLAILTFSMSLIGTFIVRSGLITSVHAFATDPERGMFILGYIAVVTGAGLALFARCIPERSEPPALLSRGGFILVNNMVLVCAAATVLLAILYPVFLTLAGLPSITVGPPYFNATFLPLTAPLVVLAAIAPLLPWQGRDVSALNQALKTLLPLSIGVLVFLLAISHVHDLFAALGIAMACWLAHGTIIYTQKIWRAIPTSPNSSRLSRIKLRSIAGIMGHAGLAMLVLGIALTAAFKTSFEHPIRAGEIYHFHDYSVYVRTIERAPRKNFIAQTAHITVKQDGETLAHLAPETRFYPVRGEETAESSVRTFWWGDMYAVIGRTTMKAENATTIVGLKIYIVPGQHAIWLGFILVALAGLLSAVSSWRKEGTHVA